MRRKLCLLGMAALPYLALPFVQKVQDSRAPDYATAVQPIFSAHCVSCHSAANPASGLDLSTPKGIEKGGNKGPLWIAGHPERSLLLRMVTPQGGQPAAMPMGFAPLKAQQVATLTAWVAGGAKFTHTASTTKHWAYAAPAKPSLPPLRSGHANRSIGLSTRGCAKKNCDLHPQRQKKRCSAGCA